MKYIITIVLALTAHVFAADDDFTLTPINDWTLQDMAFGLDVYESPDSFVIIAGDCIADDIQMYDPSTGQPTGQRIGLHTKNVDIFGVVWNGDTAAPELYTNDWKKPFFFSTADNGGSWTSSDNSETTYGRGMDFDGVNYWMATGGLKPALLRFQPGGTQERFTTTDIPKQSSGLTVFPYQGKTMIAISSYSIHHIFFYIWDGISLTYSGRTPCPASDIFLSLGLTCKKDGGNLFWTYIDKSESSRLIEMSLQMQSLEQSSWGAIKGSF